MQPLYIAMQANLQRSILLLLFVTSACAKSDVSWNGTEPDGYLLCFKVVEIFPDHKNNISGYNHYSLFRVDFDGTVIEFWNNSLEIKEMIFQYQLFAIDTENELVYVGVNDQFLALDLETGIPITRILLKPPHLQIFNTYDYFPKEKAIYGICIGNGPYYYSNWCRMNQTGMDKVELEYLFTLPLANESGPMFGLFYLDQEEQMIWYYPNLKDMYAISVNITTTEVHFTSGVISPFEIQDVCIVHDRSMDRVFTYVWYYNDSSNLYTSLGLGELFPNTSKVSRKIVLDLSQSEYSGLVPADTEPGTCTYDQTTHTMMVLLRNYTDYDHQMPTGLLLIDTVSLTYKYTPLPTFRKKWDSTEKVSDIQFIPNPV